MTETTPGVEPEATTSDTAAVRSAVDDRRPHRHHTNRLYQTAAWVAIVAGIVFIVGAVFFTGFVLGRHSGDGWRHHGGGVFMPRPPGDRDGPPMMDPDDMGPGMMGPGMMGPGMRPQGGASPSSNAGPPRP